MPAESLNVDIAGCGDLETREEQRSCYLARVEEAVEARRDAPEPQPQLQPQPQPQPQPQDVATAAATASQEPNEADSVEREIVATITSLREMEPDAYLIELDNGQVWRQNTPKRYLLREGAEVHLEPTRWGESYRLNDPEVGNFIQVERIR